MGITVKQLLKFCDEQVKKGNGDKEILISNDDEGNGYHTLFYGFTDDKKEIESIAEFCCFHDDNDLDNIVILG